MDKGGWKGRWGMGKKKQIRKRTRCSKMMVIKPMCGLSLACHGKMQVKRVQGNETETASMRRGDDL